MQFKRLVAHGYDIAAERFARELAPDTLLVPWIERLAGALPLGARVLDLGCGAGVSYTAYLARRFDVIGVDISREQLRLAAASVQGGQFVLADMASLHFPPASFDAVTALYSVIHVPRHEQPGLFRSIRGWLKPSGRAFLVLGGGDTLMGYESDWFGAPMLWSHFDCETSLRLLEEAGLGVIASAVEGDPIDPRGHQLFALCHVA